MPKMIEGMFRFIRREVLRDPFLLEVKRWFRVDGDNTLRLDYPLGKNAVVWDLGGYHGDFAAQILKKFDCRIYLFEPVPRFNALCVERFRGNEHVVCLPYGLSREAGWLEIDDSEDASSFVRSSGGNNLLAEVRPVAVMFDELGVEQVDLLKINIEGGEFDVLSALLDAGLMTRIHFLQVQFHDFVPQARERRDEIRQRLARTHRQMWNYPFVWESWQLK